MENGLGGNNHGIQENLSVRTGSSFKDQDQYYCIQGMSGGIECGGVLGSGTVEQWKG
jgi:hypothetical protein